MAFDIKLKKSIWIKSLSLAYIVIPFFLFFAQLLRQGLLNSDIAIQSVFEFLSQISTLDTLWLVLFLLSGAFLLIVHKLSWYTSFLFSLILFSMSLFANSQSSRGFEALFFRGDSVVTLFLIVAIFVIGLNYKYPYVDVRGSLFKKVSPRFEVKTPVEIYYGQTAYGESSSLSLSGAKIQMNEEMARHLKPQDIIMIKFPQIQMLELRAKVVESRGLVLRIEFVGSDKNRLNVMKAWIDEFVNQQKQ